MHKSQIPIEVILDMRDNKKMKFQEIADAVGRGYSTIQSRYNEAKKKGIISKQVTTDNTPKGLAGFKQLHNLEIQKEKHLSAIKKKINDFINVHLKLKAYIKAGGKETDANAPAGWIYETDIPAKAALTKSDFDLVSDDYTKIKIPVVPDISKPSRQVYCWVDPDNVEAYQKAILGE